MLLCYCNIGSWGKILSGLCADLDLEYAEEAGDHAKDLRHMVDRCVG